MLCRVGGTLWLSQRAWLSKPNRETNHSLTHTHTFWIPLWNMRPLTGRKQRGLKRHRHPSLGGRRGEWRSMESLLSTHHWTLLNTIVMWTAVITLLSPHRQSLPRLDSCVIEHKIIRDWDRDIQHRITQSISVYIHHWTEPVPLQYIYMNNFSFYVRNTSTVGVEVSDWGGRGELLEGEGNRGKRKRSIVLKQFFSSPLPLLVYI